MGDKAKAGLFGCGLVTEVGLEANRPADWQDSASPERTSPAVEIDFLTVAPGLLITRPELKETHEFSDGSFDLFKMPQRPNPFTVEGPHLHRLGDLLAAKGHRRVVS